MGFPTPEAGLVISYSYLWQHEAAAGQVEGRKNRPCAIVLVVQDQEEGTQRVTVAPITHSPPANPEHAIAIPAPVKRHLGLDDQPSWIVLDDFNVFAWPGFDLRPIPGQPGQFSYGFLPPQLFNQVIAKIGLLLQTARTATTPRDDEA
jgi:hypothetical protein